MIYCIYQTQKGGMRIMEEKFEDIFRACYPPIVKYLQSAKQLSLHEAEDIASEAFLLMYQKWDTLTYHTKAAMYKWAALTANNILRNRQRKEQRRPLILSWEQDITPSMMPQEDPAAYETSVEAYESCLASLMAALSPPERELLTCKILRRMSDEETAVYLNISLGTMRTRWSRLRKKIDKERRRKGGAL